MSPRMRPPSLGVLLLAVMIAPRNVSARLGLGATTLTRKTFEEFVHANDKVLVDFARRDTSDWHKRQAELESAVRQVRGYGCRVPLATVDVKAEEELAKHFVPRGNFPQLLWFLHGEPTQYHRPLRSSKSISDFVMALDRDPIVPVQDANEVDNYNRAVLAEIRRNSSMYDALEVAAARHMDSVAVNFLDSGKDVVTWRADDSEPLKYEGEATPTAVDRWFRAQLTKSEPVPEPPEGGGPVIDDGSVVVVGQTFEELVLRADQDVMLLVYAPWCGFSRKVLPVWEAFARAVAGVQHVVVAKMDGSRNGTPFPDDFAWKAYPTILHVRAGQAWPSVFHGNRTVSNFVRFAEEHASKPLNLDPATTQEIESEL